MSNFSQDKQIRLLLALIRSLDYSHPLLFQTCEQLKINPADLRPKRIEDFADKKTGPDIHELRYNHYEAKRKTKLDLVVNTILKNGWDFNSFISRKISPVHRQGRSLSPTESESLLVNSKPETSSIHPLIHTLSQKKYLYQKKKLDHLIKVIGNIKQIKYNQEKKKIQINLETQKKMKKIEEEKNYSEEKRIQKINKIQAKREEILKKNQLVNCT
jgi:hypothetical protein